MKKKTNQEKGLPIWKKIVYNTTCLRNGLNRCRI